MTITTAAKITFGSFTIERKYQHPPQRVFRAGGHEHGQFRPVGHPSMFGNDTRHLEIVKNERIVSAYTMSVDGKPFSHSLATIELVPNGANGCKLTYTEQGAYFGGEGEQEITNRKAGCEELFGKLAEELRTHP